MKDNTTKFGGAFLIGGLIGAAIALLYAPKSGRRTRKDIIRVAHRAKNSAANLMEDTIDDANAFMNDLKEKASAIADQGMDLTDKVKKEIMATIEQGHKAIEKQEQKFAKTLGL